MPGKLSGAFGRLVGRKPPTPTDAAIAAPPKPRADRFGFNAAGSAGPRRLAVIATGASVVAVAAAAVIFTGSSTPVVSQTARLKDINPLPGGQHSTPEQDALALRSNDSLAQAAQARGASYTPPLAPSRPVSALPPVAEQPSPQPPPAPAKPTIWATPHFLPPPNLPPQPRSPAPSPTPAPTVVAKPEPPAAPVPKPLQPTVTLVAAPGGAPAGAPESDPYAKQIADMMAGWGARSFPRTDVVLPPVPDDTERPDDATPRSSSSRRPPTPLPVATPISSRSGDGGGGQILVPAGRGVFAHPILAVNSDATSPVVLQADSGPLARDRMLGSFAKQNDKLIIHITTVVHQGEEIGVDGVVITPDTMEAGVASSVDQHYLERFILPAAASFVAGLGQAIATTSNSVQVLSPLGGATTSSNLNIRQQLGVGAGAAAAQIGQTLSQAAPKGPTVSLEANVAVGVMFLSNVVAHSSR